MDNCGGDEKRESLFVGQNCLDVSCNLLHSNDGETSCSGQKACSPPGHLVFSHSTSDLFTHPVCSVFKIHPESKWLNEL